MNTHRPIACLFVLLMLFTPATAHAGEAIEALKGAWVVETSNGDPPPEGVKMVMTFVDDETLRIVATFEDKREKKDIKYSATEDGEITMFPEPKENPDGEKATWEVRDDKKLYLTNEEGEVLVLAREAE